MINNTIQQNLAPIGLSVYSRLDHLKRTVAALQNNELAGQSILYIFSDAPRPGAESKVQAVRDYLKTITGFKEIHIIEREENNRVENNRGGMKMLLAKYDKMIFIEEDVITSPFFLKFMNEALNLYENDQRIFAITGYGLPLDFPPDYNKDAILSRRMFAWAFGIWKNRFEQTIFNMTMKDYWAIRLNPWKSKAYCEAGDNVLPQLHMVASGKVEALDIRIDYTIFIQNKYIIAPSYSMIQSIGLDGTGEHWTCATDKYNTILAGKPIIVDMSVKPDIRILKDSARFNMMSFEEKRSLFLLDLKKLLRLMK